MDRIAGEPDALGIEIDASGLDAVVAVSPENVTYCSGVVVWTQRTLRERLAMVVRSRGGECVFLVAGQEKGYAQEKGRIRDVRSYVAHGPSPIIALVDVLREMDLASGRIGIEPSYLSADYHRELVDGLPEADLTSCEPLFRRARMIKTESEVELLSRAALATDRALSATYATVQPGDKERSVVARLAGNMLQTGADLPAFLHLTLGSNTSHAHPDPTDYLAQTGDLVKSDCGGYFAGYCSDVARTAVIGKATAEQRSIYDRLVEVHGETIDAMRPGVPARDVFETASRGYSRAGIPFPMAFAGHGIGLGLHEAPLLSADDPTPLAPNMVFCVETRVRWPGKEGYHIEDTVVVTEQGPRVATTFMPTSELLEL